MPNVFSFSESGNLLYENANPYLIDECYISNGHLFIGGSKRYYRVAQNAFYTDDPVNVGVYDVDLATGMLTADAAKSPYSLITYTDEGNLITDGYGSYYIDRGRVILDDSAFKQLNRSMNVKAQITYRDGYIQDLTATEIVSVKVVEGIGSGIPIGGAPAASFTLILDNSSNQWDTGGLMITQRFIEGAKVSIEIGSTGYDEVYDYAKVGTFYVDEIETQEQSLTAVLRGLDANGNIMTKPYYDAPENYPRTLGNLLAAVCSDIKVKTLTFSNSEALIQMMPEWVKNEGETISRRDIAGFVAACAGGVARIDRQGRFEIISVGGKAEYFIVPANYITLTKTSGVFGPFNCLFINEFGAPTDTKPIKFEVNSNVENTLNNSVSIENNPILAFGAEITNIVGDVIKDKLIDFYARGSGVYWQGDPALTCGEFIKIKDLSGNERIMLVTSQSIDFSLGLRMTTENKLETIAKKVYYD